jgi:hypothetical protein
MRALAVVTREEPRAEGVAAVVIEIQQTEGRERKKLEERALKMLQPMLQRVVARFPPRKRGSLEPDDLLQICFIAVLKLFKRYDHAARESTTFEQHAYRDALRACMEKVRLQAFDVNISDDACRGRTKDRTPNPIQVESTDGLATPVDGASAARVGLSKEPIKTPEELLQLKQVRLLIRRLQGARREYIARYFGLEGYTAQESLAALSLDLGVSKSKLFREIRAALGELRSMLD